MKAAEFIVTCLENEGVEYIFGVPGEENILFLNALAKSSIRYIMAADERGAAFMAAAYGRLTGKPGVVVTTLGPGALNIPNGLAFAHLANIPLVAIAWQKGYRESKKDNGFMYVDFLSTFKNITKKQKTIYSPSQISLVIRDAFKEAQMQKSGPILIEVPEEINEEIVNGVAPLPNGIKNHAAPPSKEALASIIESLREAKNPSIITGFRAIPYHELIGKLARLSGIHVITTPMSQGILPSNHQQSLFSFSYHQKDLLHNAVNQADVVITIGYSPIEFSPRFWNADKTKKVIHIDSTSSVLHEHYNPMLELIGNIGVTLKDVSQQIRKEGLSWRADVFQQARKQLSQDNVDETAFPIKPQYLIKVLKEESKNTIFSHDNGMHKLWVSRFLHPDQPNQVLVDNVLGSMAAGIAQGITAKLIHPNKRVIVNIGEGGLLMSLGELGTIAALNLPITICVWHDGGHGMIIWHQQRKNLQSANLSIKSPDYIKLAESFGGTGYQVSHSSELRPTLKKALQQNHLTIIDCPVDYSEGLQVFSDSYEHNTN